jgi:hypothetical protein
MSHDVGRDSGAQTVFAEACHELMSVPFLPGDWIGSRSGAKQGR